MHCPNMKSFLHVKVLAVLLSNGTCLLSFAVQHWVAGEATLVVHLRVQEPVLWGTAVGCAHLFLQE